MISRIFSITIFVFLIITITGCTSINHTTENISDNHINQNTTNNEQNNNNEIRLSGIVNGNPPCTKSGNVTLTKPMINPDDLKAIWPLGRTANGHVTPTDHQYYITTDAAKKNGAVIYAPADGIIFGIIGGDASKNTVEKVNVPSEIKYGLAIAFSCNEAMTLGYLSKIAPELQKYVSYDTTAAKLIYIPVKAGEVIGEVKGGMDVWLIDSTSKLSGFVDDEDYTDENWKPYSHSLADYFEPSLRNRYNSKSLRKVEPFGGKIDYDNLASSLVTGSNKEYCRTI